MIRVATFLRDTFPDAEDVAWGKLVRTVGEQVRRAMQYGFSAEQDVATYVITAWLLGENFDTEFPAAVQILSSTDGAAARAASLEEWTKILFAALEEEDR